MKRIVLKEFKDLIDNKISLKEYEKICWNYADKLEENGWENIIIEGGVCSPDKGTFFIYNRSFYYGMLLDSGYLAYFFKNHEERDIAFNKVCQDLLNSDDFIEIDW